MALFEMGANVGALMPVSDTWYDRPAIVQRLRSTWNMRNRRPRVGGAERQIGRSMAFRRALSGISVSVERAPVRGLAADVLAQRWLRGLVPAENDQQVKVTFDSWHNVRTTAEITTGPNGVMTVANLPAVRAAFRIVQSVVVQVWSLPDRSIDSGPTVRVWVCNGDGSRAIDAKVLEQNLLLDGCDASEIGRTRFATGWFVTGEPGGARRPR